MNANLRDSILMSNRQCNDVAPQGLRTPGKIQHLGIPWDGQLQRYKFGNNVALIDGISGLRGTTDFTVTATITPRRDGQIALGRFAALLFRRQSDVERPIAIYLGYDNLSRQFDFFLGANFSLQNASQGISPRFDEFRANVSVTIKFIRQGVNLVVFANDTQIGNSTANETFNFGRSLAFPIEIGPPIFPTNSPEIEDILRSMDADVSDISISDIAEVPPMEASQVSI